MRSDVAVLYVDPRGPYPELVREWFDEARNAETYSGSLPVVAHPPCGPWSRLKAFNKHQRRHHALFAVPLVRLVGGVLEHPADSTLWRTVKLPRPNGLPDQWGGWTLEIDQCRFGHAARKLTWLYIVGCSRENLPPIPAPRSPSHSLTADRGLRKRLRADGVLQASAEQRRRTPPQFAEWLLEIAGRCAGHDR